MCHQRRCQTGSVRSDPHYQALGSSHLGFQRNGLQLVGWDADFVSAWEIEFPGVAPHFDLGVNRIGRGVHQLQDARFPDLGRPADQPRFQLSRLAGRTGQAAVVS